MEVTPRPHASKKSSAAYSLLSLSFPGLLTTIAAVSLAFVCPSTCPQVDASFSQQRLHSRLRCRSGGASQEPVNTLG